MQADTIFAPATAPGRAGVAVIRISGPRAGETLTAFGMPLPTPRVAMLVCICHPTTREEIDRALALWFPAPASFTGEDVTELHVHGGRAVMDALLAALGDLPGLRLAGPGEFSRRAFLNGKMDLTEAEGLADLIDAETDLQRRQALRALSGEQGRRFEALRTEIVTALARLEAWIDFPDEDIPPQAWEAAVAGVEMLRHGIRGMLADGHRGERIRDGISIVILGAPNAGKSSLMNALARRDVAIVSHLAGTTRDVIEAHLDLDGAPVVLVDTAGLRDSDDPIEQEGVRRARARASAADIKLVCFDGNALTRLDVESMALLDQNAIAIATKIDVASGAVPEGFIGISALRGDGMEILLAEMKARAASLADGASTFITRARHREVLAQALAHLERFSPRLSPELACEELRRAAAELGKITGKITVDELLDRVFREFCIGK